MKSNTYDEQKLDSTAVAERQYLSLVLRQVSVSGSYAPSLACNFVRLMKKMLTARSGDAPLFFNRLPRFGSNLTHPLRKHLLAEALGRIISHSKTQKHISNHCRRGTSAPSNFLQTFKSLPLVAVSDPD